MPSYKLTYFNSRGRAEPIRVIFALKGVKYEDVRLEQAQWQELKPKTPFGQLPMLEIDGKVMTQSMAIIRYLAREHGLYGSSSLQAFQVDVVTEIFDDLMQALLKAFFEEDEEKRKEYITKCYAETVPKILKDLEKVLCENKGGNGFFVGDKLSVADIVFLTNMDHILNPEFPPVLDATPKLKALLGRLKANEMIAAWLKKRPQTEY